MREVWNAPTAAPPICHTGLSHRAAVMPSTYHCEERSDAAIPAKVRTLARSLPDVIQPYRPSDQAEALRLAFRRSARRNDRAIQPCQSARPINVLMPPRSWPHVIHC
jgi:hypothetical protein